MNENLQEALAAIVTRAVEGVDTATAFIQGEAPEVVQQLLTWKMFESLIYFGVGLFAIFILLPLSIWFISVSMRFDDDSHHWCFNCGEPIFILGFLGALISTLSGSLFMFFNLEWIQIWISPKVWLLEYAANLVK